MDATQRVDYFRSELVGKIELANKATDELEKRLTQRIQLLEEKIVKLTSELQYLRLSR